MTFKLFLVLCCILHYPISYSQIAEPSSVVDKYILQVEMEAQYALQKEGIEKIVTWCLPNSLFRYGLFKDVELQLNSPLIKEQFYVNDNLVNNTNRFTYIQTGASVNLWEQRNVIPEAAFMARIIIPVQKEEQFNKVGEIIAFNFSNSISEKFSLNYNIGFVRSCDNTNQGYYDVNLMCCLNQKNHLFIEIFSDFDAKSVSSHTINLGGGYAINKNVCFDMSMANGLNRNLFYTSLRLTWAINTKNYFL